MIVICDGKVHTLEESKVLRIETGETNRKLPMEFLKEFLDSQSSRVEVDKAILSIRQVEQRLISNQISLDEVWDEMYLAILGDGFKEHPDYTPQYLI